MMSLGEINMSVGNLFAYKERLTIITKLVSTCETFSFELHFFNFNC